MDTVQSSLDEEQNKNVISKSHFFLKHGSNEPLMARKRNQEFNLSLLCSPGHAERSTTIPQQAVLDAFYFPPHK